MHYQIYLYRVTLQTYWIEPYLNCNKATLMLARQSIPLSVLQETILTSWRSGHLKTLQHLKMAFGLSDMSFTAFPAKFRNGVWHKLYASSINGRRRIDMNRCILSGPRYINQSKSFCVRAMMLRGACFSKLFSLALKQKVQKAWLVST